MNVLTFDKVVKRLENTKGFKILEKKENKVEIYDEIENKFFTYKDIENLNLLDIFEFNSLEVGKIKFLNLIELLNKNLFMIVDKVYFTNNKKEVEGLLERFPEQNISSNEYLGIYLYQDNSIVINTYLISKITLEDTNIFKTSHEEEFNRCIWQTLIHELRHSLVENPIITEEEIPLEENTEENIERYCISTFEKIIEPKDYQCFKPILYF